MRYLLTFLLLIGGGYFLSGFFSVPPATPDNEWAEAIVKRHNEYRAEFNIAPLEWSDDLATFAQAWADEIARSNKIRHRPKGGKNKIRGYGENMAGTYEPENGTKLVEMWGEEKANYDFKNMRCKSANLDCGHYTQIIWENSRRVGCGVAKMKDGMYIAVCNYDPPGNVLGRFPFGNAPDPDRDKPEVSSENSQFSLNMLAAHNKFREELGIAPLEWSKDLADFAEEWAEELVRSHQFSHRLPIGQFRQRYGENIFQGFSADFAPSRVVEYWARGKSQFNLNTLECEGKKGDCEEYTQIIWENTAQVGCAIAERSNGETICVCNYDPKGNKRKEKPFQKK